MYHVDRESRLWIAWTCFCMCCQELNEFFWQKIVCYFLKWFLTFTVKSALHNKVWWLKRILC